MKKLFTVFLMTLMLSLIGFQQISVETVYAVDVKFSGITAPKGCNARLQPKLNGRTLYTIPGNTTVNFEGWVNGDSVSDYWTGQPDTRWFFFTDTNRQKVYTASAGINGNPPNSPDPDPDPDPNPTGNATVPEIQQQMSNWCWATSTSAVLQHYGFNVTQQQVVYYTKGSLVNQTGTDSEMLNAANHFGLYANAGYNIPSYGDVQREINSGNPLETMIGWTTGGGHAQVLDGCFNNGGRNYIKIMDPWYGDHFDYAYDYYQSNSKFSWQAYIGNFRRK